MRTKREIDEHQWLEETASYVKSLNLPELSESGLYDFLVEMGNSDRKAIDSQVIRLIMHLLKFRYQPEKISKSWKLSTIDARDEIALDLERAPSLKTFLAQSIQNQKNYDKARRKAEVETGLKMPKTNPFTLDEILDDDFFG